MENQDSWARLDAAIAHCDEFLATHVPDPPKPQGATVFQIQVPGKGGFRSRRTKWVSAMFADSNSAEDAQWLVDHWNKDAQWIEDNLNQTASRIVHYRIIEVPAKPRLTPAQIQNNLRLFLQKNPNLLLDDPDS